MSERTGDPESWNIVILPDGARPGHFLTRVVMLDHKESFPAKFQVKSAMRQAMSDQEEKGSTIAFCRPPSRRAGDKPETEE